MLAYGGARFGPRRGSPADDGVEAVAAQEAAAIAQQGWAAFVDAWRSLMQSLEAGGVVVWPITIAAWRVQGGTAVRCSGGTVAWEG